MLNLADVVVAAFEVDVFNGDIVTGRLLEGSVDYAKGATC